MLVAAAEGARRALHCALRQRLSEEYDGRLEQPAARQAVRVVVARLDALERVANRTLVAAAWQWRRRPAALDAPPCVATALRVKRRGWRDERQAPGSGPGSSYNHDVPFHRL